MAGNDYVVERINASNTAVERTLLSALPTGAQGFQGWQGWQGSDGSGAQGNQGNQGWQGVQGSTGVEFGVAASDETTALTTGAAKVTFRVPIGFSLTGVRADVVTAPTGGTLLTVDIKMGGVSIFTTQLTFNSGSDTTVGATPYVLTSNPLTVADNAKFTVDIVSVGSTVAGAGLKVWITGTR